MFVPLPKQVSSLTIFIKTSRDNSNFSHVVRIFFASQTISKGKSSYSQVFLTKLVILRSSFVSLLLFAKLGVFAKLLLISWSYPSNITGLTRFYSADLG